MKLQLKSLAIASFMAFGALSVAHAEAVVSNITNDINSGWTLNGSGALGFSKTLVTALNAGGIEVSAVAPASVDVTWKRANVYNTISANAPVVALTAALDGQTLGVNKVMTNGGASMLATADDLTNSGGSLSITRISVDLGAKMVYADVQGGNGVGAIEAMPMWSFANISGPTALTLVNGTATANNVLTGLTITPVAYNTFIQSLGLLESGVAALKAINDYGTLTSAITVTSVPEPASVGLMALGMLGLAAAARRRQR